MPERQGIKLPGREAVPSDTNSNRITEAAGISPEACEAMASRFEEIADTAGGEVIARFILDDAAAQIRALRSALTAAQHARDGLNAACGQWKEAFDAKDAALQQARSALTARDDALASIRVFAQDCIENSHDRGHIGNLYSIRDLCDSKGETK